MENEHDLQPVDPEYKITTLTTVFKQKRTIFTVFILIMLLVTVIVLMREPAYQAKSTVLVKMGREYLVRPELGEKVPPTLSVDQEGIISSELQILSSKELREKVVRQVKAEKLYPDLALLRLPDGASPDDVAAVRLEQNLKMTKVKNSNVIEIAFEHGDPRVAAQVVNLLVEFFREKHLQVFREPQSTFLQQQLEIYSQKLAHAESALEGFKKRNDVFSLDEQRTLLLRQKMEMDAALKQSNNGINELNKKVATLKKQLSTVYRSDDSYTLPADNDNIQDAKTKLLNLLLEQQQLLRKYSPSNKLVLNSKNEIEVVKKYITGLESEVKTKARTGNQIYLDVYRDLLMSEASLNSLIAKTASIRGQLNQVDKSIRNINDSEQRLENLKREKLTYEKNYQVYLDKVEESRMLDEMNRQKLANISVIQAAAVPVIPSSPSRAKVMLLGAMFGAFLALAGGFLLERSDQSFSTPQKVERVLRQRVLASIPYH